MIKLSCLLNSLELLKFVILRNAFLLLTKIAIGTLDPVNMDFVSSQARIDSLGLLQLQKVSNPKTCRSILSWLLVWYLVQAVPLAVDNALVGALDGQHSRIFSIASLGRQLGGHPQRVRVGHPGQKGRGLTKITWRRDLKSVRSKWYVVDRFACFLQRLPRKF